jgi:UDPglucose 6-dehydrogenase
VLIHDGASAGCRAEILEAIDRADQAHRAYLAEQILRHFGNDVRGRRVALWGLAFKPNTDDLRESPAIAILERLVAAGATVSAYDPAAKSLARAAFLDRSGLELAADAYAACQDADALAVATEWGEFRNPDFERLRRIMRTPAIFDGRNLYDPERVRAHGFHYLGIGRT